MGFGKLCSDDEPSEFRLLMHYDIWTPLGCKGEEVFGSVRSCIGEVVGGAGHAPSFLIRRTNWPGPNAEALDMGRHVRTGCEHHRMAGLLGRLGKRKNRVYVTEHWARGEQNPHLSHSFRLSLSATCCIMSRFVRALSCCDRRMELECHHCGTAASGTGSTDINQPRPDHAVAPSHPERRSRRTRQEPTRTTGQSIAVVNSVT